MTERKSSINTQASLILGGVTTDGAGGFAAPLRQQGVVLTDANPAGWQFFTDGTDGVIRCNTDVAPAQNGYVVASAHSGALVFLVESSYVSPTQIELTIRDPADQSAVDLATNVVALQLIAATL